MKDLSELIENFHDPSGAEWKALGYNKSTLYYLKKGAKNKRQFEVYGKLKRRLRCCPSTNDPLYDTCRPHSS